MKIVQLLIKSGADLEAVDDEGHSAVGLANENGNLK